MYIRSLAPLALDWNALQVIGMSKITRAALASFVRDEANEWQDPQHDPHVRGPEPPNDVAYAAEVPTPKDPGTFTSWSRKLSIAMFVQRKLALLQILKNPNSIYNSCV